MVEFIGIFAILLDNKIQYTSLQMNGYNYPVPEDSVELCNFAKQYEPFEFIDLVGVVDIDRNIVWDDIE